jgi:signal transduction histidine kinase
MTAESSDTDAMCLLRQELAAARFERDRLALGLQHVLTLANSAVRMVDVTGAIVRTHVDGSDNAKAEPRTVRELWERQSPRDGKSELAVPFLETPALRALSGQTVRGQLLIVNGEGVDERRMLEASASPMIDDSGTLVGAVLLDRDVTYGHRLERALGDEVLRTSALLSRVMAEADRIELIVEERAKALASREATLSRDRRLAAVGQLAAGVMHDVNNALNPIMAAAYLLRHHAESPSAVRDYADRIRMAAETGAATAARVGRFIRQEPLHAGVDTELDLSMLGDEVLELTEPMWKARAHDGQDIEVVRDFAPEVFVRGLAGEIREALFSLVSNAVDAMPCGGRLILRTFRANDEACVQVVDSGAGMSDEVRERAMEPFFTTKGAAGSGLGLAEVYGIARRHRGSVNIESTEGAGTTVSLTFPYHASKPLGARLVGDSHLQAPLHILIVEDHDDGREFLRRLLVANGHTVEATSTLAEAIAVLGRESASPFDLVLTDVGLPDGSGWDLVALVRTRFAKIRIGVVTGWEPMISRDDAIGAEFVLRKPLRAAELLAHIAGVSPALPE